MSPVCLLWDRLSSRGLLGIPKEVWPPQSDMSLTFSGESGRCGFWRRQGTDVLAWKISSILRHSQGAR